jgi:hypothetical protein
MMPRLPRGLHRYAGATGGNPALWRPGWRGTGRQPIRRVRIEAFTRRIQSVPLTGGQAQATVTAAGAAQCSTGPAGLGTVWYPAQATISTTTGAADNSTCQIFLGALGVNNLLVGQSYAGGGDTVALAVPSMTPGDLLIAVWAGGNPGDHATMNVVGTMDALSW